MKELNHKISLSDLVKSSKSQNVVITLPQMKRSFDGSTMLAYGPTNATSISTSVSGGSTPVGYGNGDYGAGYYPESINIFNKFLLNFKDADAALIETIQSGMKLIFRK